MEDSGGAEMIKDDSGGFEIPSSLSRSEEGIPREPRTIDPSGGSQNDLDVLFMAPLESS